MQQNRPLKKQHMDTPTVDRGHMGLRAALVGLCNFFFFFSFNNRKKKKKKCTKYIRHILDEQHN